MFKKLVIAAAASTAVTPAVFAADLYTPVADPPVYTASGFDWTGIYAGAVGGYVWGRSEVIDPTGGLPTTIVNPSGGQVGITAGVNGQFDQFVLGLEGEILWSGVTGTAPIPTFTDITTVKSNWQGAIKARAGVALDKVLIYAHGGLAFADYYSSVHTAGGALLVDYRTSRTGWTVGAGVEMAVTDNVTIKAEYAYTDFGKWTGVYTTPAGTPFDTDFTYHTHAIKAGVNFHF
ncbi:outer membrane protein [Devosia sp. MC521]|uniref:outer membrane protein n=1 Tax=Devosia sp. MC521 TaxID=2759954 RepID=UPI0015F8ACFF|nr:outer membrane protein [Devosia sp. MC521]MBJ6987302.1 porin family protein [Devosia sp. MC521]QMW63480.1 porin family protein [Devosia sp. MC521]